METDKNIDNVVLPIAQYTEAQRDVLAAIAFIGQQKDFVATNTGKGLNNWLSNKLTELFKTHSFANPVEHKEKTTQFTWSLAVVKAANEISITETTLTIKGVERPKPDFDLEITWNGAAPSLKQQEKISKVLNILEGKWNGIAQSFKKHKLTKSGKPETHTLGHIPERRTPIGLPCVVDDLGSEYYDKPSAAANSAAVIWKRQLQPIEEAGKSLPNFDWQIREKWNSQDQKVIFYSATYGENSEQRIEPTKNRYSFLVKLRRAVKEYNGLDKSEKYIDSQRSLQRSTSFDSLTSYGTVVIHKDAPSEDEEEVDSLQSLQRSSSFDSNGSTGSVIEHDPEEEKPKEIASEDNSSPPTSRSRPSTLLVGISLMGLVLLLGTYAWRSGALKAWCGTKVPFLARP